MIITANQLLEEQGYEQFVIIISTFLDDFSFFLLWFTITNGSNYYRFLLIRNNQICIPCKIFMKILIKC